MTTRGRIDTRCGCEPFLTTPRDVIRRTLDALDGFVGDCGDEAIHRAYQDLRVAVLPAQIGDVHMTFTCDTSGMESALDEMEKVIERMCPPSLR